MVTLSLFSPVSAAARASFYVLWRLANAHCPGALAVGGGWAGSLCRTKWGPHAAVSEGLEGGFIKRYFCQTPCTPGIKSFWITHDAQGTESHQRVI